MSTPDDQEQRESHIRTLLDQILEQLEKDRGSGQDPPEEAIEQAINQGFATPEDRLTAKSQYQRRRLNRGNAGPALKSDKVWYPIHAESALTEFKPSGPPIAYGSTSEIYVCDTRFSKITFVVKLLVHDRQRIMTMLAMREFQALIRRRHRNVVSVLDAGQLRVGDDEQYPYIAMENLDGVTLQEWFEAHGPDRRLAAEIVSVLADAITFCHEDEVNHGDISPNNVMVCGDLPCRETLKLIDFGLSGLGGETPGYGDPATATSDFPCLAMRDIYSLGAMLYFCATGQHPPKNTSEADHTAWVAKIDLGNSDLNLICRKCLAYSPSDRYQLPQQLEDDLKDWLGDSPLRHVRKDGYKWQEKWKLLWKRGRERNDIADHTQIVAIAAIVLSVAIVATGAGHVLQVAQGVDPEIAYFRALNMLNGFTLLLVAGFGYAIRFRVPSMAILEPLAGLAISALCLLFCIEGQPFGTSPTWQELNKEGQFFLLLIGVIHLAYASVPPQSTAMRCFGWFVMFLTFFLRPLFESRFSAYAMPIVIMSIEAIACWLSARRLWAIPVPSQSETTQHRPVGHPVATPGTMP